MSLGRFGENKKAERQTTHDQETMDGAQGHSKLLRWKTVAVNASSQALNDKMVTSNHVNSKLFLACSQYWRLLSRFWALMHLNLGRVVLIIYSARQENSIKI
jgi:hypothetical protein